MEFIHLSHCVYHCNYHVVMVTKYRKEIFKQKFPLLKQVYWGTDAIWSEGYFVSTAGIDEAIIKAYIEDQGKKDAGQTKFEIS